MVADIPLKLLVKFNWGAGDGEAGKKERGHLHRGGLDPRCSVWTPFSLTDVDVCCLPQHVHGAA